MDIRNIKQKAPRVEGGAYLEKMYQLQKELIEGYIKIEGLPNYPLNINNKKAQVILKDFSARVTEELAEGFESTHLAINILKKEGFNVNRLSPSDWQMMYNHLQNSNEEQADATAFFLEMFIYADINPSDIQEFIIKENLMPENSPEGLLEKLMLIGVVLLNKENTLLLDMPLRYELLDPSDFESPDKYEEVKGYIPAFTNMSEYSHELEPLMLWQVNYHIGVARNYLKNKPWKQSGELTDERPYFRENILGFIKYMGYLCIMGFTPETLYSLFWRKNRVNLFRQKSKY